MSALAAGVFKTGMLVTVEVGAHAQKSCLSRGPRWLSAAPIYIYILN